MMDHTHTHTHTFNGPFSRTTQVSRYQKGKPIWILLKQETVSGNTISWTTCKSAPPSRQITMPAPYHSVFTGQMPFLPPNQQCQSTGGTHGSHSASDKVAVKKICTCWLLTPQRNMQLLCLSYRWDWRHYVFMLSVHLYVDISTAVCLQILHRVFVFLTEIH